MEIIKESTPRTEEESHTPETSEPLSFRPENRIKSFLPPKRFLMAFILAIMALGFLTLSSQKPNIKEPIPIPAANTQKPDGAIAKIGQEFIYQQDLDFEIAHYPQGNNEEVKKFLLTKIATDSAILQGAQKEKLITLDSTTYNSSEKDYTKRIKLVETAKRMVSEKSNGIKGTVVAIWFFNNKEGSLGYEKGKQFAFDKISKIHDEVKSGALTIEQTGEKIKNDSSLIKVDTAYKTNAYFNFDVQKGQTITFVPEFDALLWKSKPGEVTEVYLASDKSMISGETREALYMFGQVSEAKTNNKINSLDEWINQQIKAYEVKYY
jgi:hypothetical protein